MPESSEDKVLALVNSDVKLTWAQAAQFLGITRQRIHQILQKNNLKPNFARVEFTPPEVAKEKAREKAKNFYLKKKAERKCIRCEKSLDESYNHGMCKNCRLIHADCQKGIRQRRKAEGICLRCSNPAIPGQTACVDCAEKAVARTKAWRSRSQPSAQVRHCDDVE